MRNTIIIAISAVFILVEVAMIAIGLGKDTQCPSISIYQESIDYTFGCDNEVLLKGVSAVDNKDGDVSAGVTISERTVMVTGKLEAVTFAVCDKEGNLSQMKVLFVTEDDGTFKILEYKNYHVNKENLQFSIEGATLTGTVEQVQVIAPSQTNKSTEEGQESDQTTTVQDENATTKNNSEEPTSKQEEPTTEEPETTTIPSGYNGADGSPQMYLKESEVTISVGGKVNWVKLIDEIFDDVDGRNTLFKRVKLTETFDFSTPGDYRQGLYCTDTDGNKSNIVYVIVHVVE